MGSRISRRSVLGAGAAGLAAGTFGLSTTASGAQRRGRRAKNIIFCVSDGMSAGVLTMVDHLSIMNGKGNSYWGWLMKQPFVVNGLQDTRSLNSIVTDSSAASSSWGCGRHIWNGQVNMFPDGTELRTLTSLMVEAGVRCGLVTTATITHATPAGFAVNCVQRDLEALIAEKYLTSGVHVLMGGGDRFFSPKTRSDKKDLYAEFTKAGYRVVKGRSEMMSVKADRLLGIFSNSHLPYTVDRDNDPELQRSVPTLAEMARVAIEQLNGKGKGFLLQIEGARVDHAAHTNDLAGTLYDQIAFEDAVRVAVEFARKDGNTLVVVTSDHGNGNPGVNGAGAEYIDSTKGLALVNGMKSSYGPVLADIGKTPTSDRVREVVEARLGVQLKAEEGQVLADAVAGKNSYASSIFYSYLPSTVGVILGNHTKTTWTSSNHTSDHVMVTALGPGSERFGGLTQNISVFDILLDQYGLKWSNPTVTFEKAQRDYEKLRQTIDPELFALYGSGRDEFHAEVSCCDWH